MDYVITPSANWTFAQLAHTPPDRDDRIIVGTDLLEERLRRSYWRASVDEQLKELKGFIRLTPRPEKAPAEALASVAARLRPTLDQRLAMTFATRGWDEEYEKLLYQRAVADVEYFERVMAARGKERDATTGAYPHAAAVVSAFAPRSPGGVHAYFAAVNIPTQTTHFLRKWTKSDQYYGLLFVDWQNLAVVTLKWLFWLILLAAILFFSLRWIKAQVLAVPYDAWVWGAGVPSALVIGLILYSVRGHQRFAYGLVECLFGIFITVEPIPASDNPWSQWFKVAAGLYVVVRGLDNIGKGIEKSFAERYPELWDRWKQRFGNQH